MLIGITGGIGAGKTIVAKYLSGLLPASLINADRICEALLEPGQRGYEQVMKRWGKRFLNCHDRIDRKVLRETIFQEPMVKKGLEEILHPLVREKIRFEKRTAQSTFIIAEVPLLYESGWQDDFDMIISVSVPEIVTINRVVQRDNVNREQVAAIIANQISIEEKNKRADVIIDNSGEWHETELKLADLADNLLKKSVLQNGTDKIR